MCIDAYYRKELKRLLAERNAIDVAILDFERLKLLQASQPAVATSSMRGSGKLGCRNIQKLELLESAGETGMDDSTGVRMLGC